MYLAIMTLASASVFALFPAGDGDESESAQSHLMDGARWTALAFARSDVGSNGTASHLLGEGWFDEEAIVGLMTMLVPEWYGWNVTWTVGGVVHEAGAMPGGDVGAYALELEDGLLLVRLFRK